MTGERSLLLIADIGGYTDYMRTHRMSLAHAEVNTSRLLGRVIDEVPDFDLIEIEGDAAFLAHRSDTADASADLAAVLAAASSMHRAFHIERQYVATNLCPCNGCNEVENLRLKFVAHVGEVATQTIRQQRKLVGIDVIQVHRMLKNPVEVPEYVLLSEELYDGGGPALTGPAREVAMDLAGIGTTRGYFVDVADLGAPPPQIPKQSVLGRLGQTFSVAGKGMPLMFGRKRSSEPASAG